MPRKEYYQKHKERLKKQIAKWKEKNPDKVKEYRKRSYRRHAEERRKTASEYRSKFPNKVREQVHRSRLKLKRNVLSHYSQGSLKCKFCSEDRIECLTIDHVFNDGNLERKKFKSGLSFYTWLRLNNYPSPERYQVLCMNCQWYKRYHPNWKGNRNEQWLEE